MKIIYEFHATFKKIFEQFFFMSRLQVLFVATTKHIPRGIGANVLGFNIIVSKFNLQSHSLLDLYPATERYEPPYLHPQLWVK